MHQKQLLLEKGYDFDRINYYTNPFTKSKLKVLLKKMNMKPSELLRKNEKAYRDLKLKNNSYTEDQILDLMVSDHDLVQRPIVEKGEKAVLARPIERIQEIL